MKILKRNKKYLHVRMTPEEYKSAGEGIAKDFNEKKAEADRHAYNQWFFDNFEEITWEDEYSKWHSVWKHKETGETRPEPWLFLKSLYEKKND